MTYIEYMNQLWRSALLSPIPASEIALFAYLVNECNKRFWKMPFVCSTTRICEELRISRQTVITARKHLAERKLIAFSEGKSRHLPSKYTILERTDDLTANLTDGLTHDLTHIKDKDKELFIRKPSEISNSKNQTKNGFSKQKENRRICPISAEGADYDSTF
jgi:DNA-binding transcriptional MocR family regulator